MILFIRSTVCTRIVRKLTLIDLRLFPNFSFINYSQHEVAKKKKKNIHSIPRDSEILDLMTLLLQENNHKRKNVLRYT